MTPCASYAENNGDTDAERKLRNIESKYGWNTRRDNIREAYPRYNIRSYIEHREAMLEHAKKKERRK